MRNRNPPLLGWMLELLVAPISPFDSDPTVILQPLDDVSAVHGYLLKACRGCVYATQRFRGLYTLVHNV